MIKRLITFRIARFMMVGVGNAALSFWLLNICFYVLHQSKIMSGVISTSCALLLSFVMNRHFVFADKSSRAHKQLPAFVIVTVSGTIILNLVYILSLNLLKEHEVGITHAIDSLFHLHLSANFIDINLSTVIGAAVAMIWNYNGYRRYVFNGNSVISETKPDAIKEAEIPA